MSEKTLREKVEELVEQRVTVNALFPKPGAYFLTPDQQQHFVVMSKIERLLVDNAALFAAAESTAAELARIKAALPKSADGVVIVPGMTVRSGGVNIRVDGFRPINEEGTAIGIYGANGSWLKTMLSDLYSVDDSALAALNSANAKGRPS